MQNTKVYVCSLCLGAGQLLEEYTVDSLMTPCPVCVGKGWTPTVTAKRGEEPLMEMNRQEKP